MRLAYLATPAAGLGWREYGSRSGYHGSAAELAEQVSRSARLDHAYAGPIAVRVWIHRGDGECESAPIPDEATVHHFDQVHPDPVVPRVRRDSRVPLLGWIGGAYLTVSALLLVLIPVAAVVYAVLFSPRLPAIPPGAVYSTSGP